jgi:hypothetical protein
VHRCRRCHCSRREMSVCRCLRAGERPGGGRGASGREEVARASNDARECGGGGQAREDVRSGEGAHLWVYMKRPISRPLLETLDG